jgi:16S rRNA G966 N2-methylase RsmD
VVAGSAGGLRLESPAGAATRPTAERVREAVFSAIGPAVRDATVLDL